MDTDTYIPETFGRLTTLGPVFHLPRPSNPKHLDPYQWVLCSCGVVKRTGRSGLLSGCTVSCGCWQLEKVTKHRHSIAGKCTPEFGAYRAMINRCYNEKVESYPHYGGRGIYVCERWLGEGGFERWLACIGPRPSKKHSLDRYPDKNGNYEPGNVRWANPEEQQGNKRTSLLLTYNGKTQHQSAWARELGIGRGVICARLKAGWSVEDALTKPVRQSNRQEATQT